MCHIRTLGVTDPVTCLINVFKSRSSTLVHEFSFAMEESKTKNSESKDEDNQLLNTTITYGCTFSNSGKLLAAFSDGKDLVVLRTDDWKQIGKRFENNGLYMGRFSVGDIAWKFIGKQDLFKQAF